MFLGNYLPFQKKGQWQILEFLKLESWAGTLIRGRNKKRLCGCLQVFTLSRLRSTALWILLPSPQAGHRQLFLARGPFHFTRNNFLTLASQLVVLASAGLPLCDRVKGH